MGGNPKYTEFLIALLIMGSAISLNSCKDPLSGAGDEAGDETLVSRTVDDVEIVSSDNGRKTSLMRAPLVQERAFAKTPYSEYPEGIEFFSYDSLGTRSTWVVADYAIHSTERDLWELRGNVRVEGQDGQVLYTQQLMLDRKINKIYSNVDSRVEDGDAVHYFEGFEGDEELSRYSGRNHTGTIYFDPDELDKNEPGKNELDNNDEPAPTAVPESETAPGSESGTAPAPQEPQEPKEGINQPQQSDI